MEPELLSPAEAQARFRAERGELTTREFLTRNKSKRIRELWCASIFGIGFEEHLGSCRIQFDEDADYDFQLEVQGVLHPFQITEVQEPDRRRGDEYRAIEKGAPSSELADWTAGTEHGHEWVRAGIQKKVDRYADVSDLHLLVYANFFAYQLPCEKLTTYCADASEPFASCWVMTDHAICTIKPHSTLTSIQPNSWARITALTP